ncbi:echinoderm microtubule-associated protein-like elp-1 isoform X2 [Cherax quadricarinatus]|uniref:echinoderm microtubule-associated protein-like elp-1 isoform X2 n=1 Tax=Cherax quadricarinatus TaxID=27406 RepID=UPI00387E8F73
MLRCGAPAMRYNMFNCLPLYHNEMIENENHSLRDRVADLEKKVHEQTDELMCLRSTLADVLRRLNTIEGATRFNTEAQVLHELQPNFVQN